MQTQPGTQVCRQGRRALLLKGLLQVVLGNTPPGQGQGQGHVIGGQQSWYIQIWAAQFEGHQHHFPALVDQRAQLPEPCGRLLGEFAFRP